MSTGVRLDFRDLPDGHVATPDDIDHELARTGYELQPLDIVVCATRAGARYGHDDFIHSGCGFGRDATLHLIEQASESVAGRRARRRLRRAI